MLTNWGRMDFPHESGTSYGPDEYSRDEHLAMYPQGWLAESVNTHPCYDPKKVRGASGPCGAVLCSAARSPVTRRVATAVTGGVRDLLRAGR